MINKITIFLLLIVFNSISWGQSEIKKLLQTYNSETVVPYISVRELSDSYNEVILLDAREKREYEVSHLKNAIHVGYNDFDIEETLAYLSKASQPIVVYCSIGVRSEDIAEQLKKRGFTRVYNLFGGIFEWSNHHKPVFNKEGKKTDRIHAYSEKWGQFLQSGTKVYE